MTDMLRDEYVERCKQRALDYLDQMKKAAALFVELLYHLMAFSVSLLMADTRLEGVDRRIEVIWVW